MPDHPHAFLIDLLAGHGRAAAHGCGFEPRLLEALRDRHAAPPGTIALQAGDRSEGQAQRMPEGLPRIGGKSVQPTGPAHVRH